MPLKYPLGTGGDPVNDWHVAIPSAWIALATNVVTQGLCIRGVNRLTAVRDCVFCLLETCALWDANPSIPQRVSSVSVNLILTVRKAVSLLISVVYYGSGFNLGLTVGAGMVLGECDAYPAVCPGISPSYRFG
jgi:UDP-xylose/UDP-N-acetylglucosamine transporter B4